MHYFSLLDEMLGPREPESSCLYVHLTAEKSSSRKPAVSKVATYRITSNPGEYLGRSEGAAAGRRGACSGLSTPCMSMQNLAVETGLPGFCIACCREAY